MADTTVAAAVLTWLEQHPAIEGAKVTLEDVLEAGEDGFILTTIPGDPYIERYKGGGGVAEFPFSIVRRVNHPDTQGRIDALKVLGDIADSIGDRTAWPVAPEGYNFDKFEVRTSPTRAASDETGADDYQVTLKLRYRKRG